MKTLLSWKKTLELALKTAKLDLREWLKKEAEKYGKYRGIPLPKIDFDIERNASYTFSADNDTCLVESRDQELAIDFQNTINDKIWTLNASLTDREVTVLKKKYEEEKSLTTIAKEIGTTPQGVVTHLRAVRRKVQRYLL